MSASPVVYLIAPPGVALGDVTTPLVDAGFTVHDSRQPLTSAVLAVIVLADHVEDPIAVTRQMRVNSPPTVPLLWLVSRELVHLATVALDAGADACLVRPISGPLLVAQFRALLRARTVTATADELRDLTARLQRLYEQTDQDTELVRCLSSLVSVRFPEIEKWRFGRTGTHGLEIAHRVRDGSCGILLIDVTGLGIVGGKIATLTLGQLLSQELAEHPPGQALSRVNVQLRRIGIPDSAIVSASVLVLSEELKRNVCVATAGFPAPVLVRPQTPAEVWVGSGPFLGTTDTAYSETVAELKPSEKLILLGPGGADRRPDIREIAERNCDLEAQLLAECLSKELGGEVTLIVAERLEA